MDRLRVFYIVKLVRELPSGHIGKNNMVMWLARWKRGPSYSITESSEVYAVKVPKTTGRKVARATRGLVTISLDVSLPVKRPEA
jgi:hypothetical protein